MFADSQWGSVESNGILHKAIFLFSEHRFIDPSEPLLTVRKRKIGLYIALQMTGVLASVAISQTIAAIGFPVIIIALIPLRTMLVPKWFSVEELEVLDDMTANNEIVLASLGGAPKLPDDSKEEDYGVERRHQEEEYGVARQRAGSMHR